MSFAVTFVTYVYISYFALQICVNLTREPHFRGEKKCLFDILN